MADVTGSVFGAQLWGFGREDQLSQGLHQRQFARAFIVGELTGQRIVLVSVDVGAIDHNVLLEVVDRLQLRFGNTYNIENVVVSATHTHSAPGGFFHTRSETSFVGEFSPTAFDHIVSGITESIAMAHENLAPGSVLVNTGIVKNAGANRSMRAYINNPKKERDRYSASIDRTMTLLKFMQDGKPIGQLNWYAVHPTSMTYENRLVSGDSKGYASWKFEEQLDTPHFVAAFAQSTPGDVTPNLNLDNTGPTDDDFQNTQYIGDQQLETAWSLFDSATQELQGPIASRQVYTNLSNYSVENEFTGVGSKKTCPSAYGYAFAAGSFEDGGGYWMFDEGMTEESWLVRAALYFAPGIAAAPDSLKTCHSPKPILFNTGTMSPPIQSQIVPITAIRIGQLGVLAVPAEVTTMAARRLKATFSKYMDKSVGVYVIAGYANDYKGYVTTPEEYSTQQYEGGHTLHGPWTLPAYQQITSKLAKALTKGGKSPEGDKYDDWRVKISTRDVEHIAAESNIESEKLGLPIELNGEHFSPGDRVISTFRSANPAQHFDKQDSFLSIQRKLKGQWVSISSDTSWDTVISWSKTRSSDFVAKVEWVIPKNTSAGVFRVSHRGISPGKLPPVSYFVGHSKPFHID
ncbi:MAG: ceramidase CerN [Halioglobus sp.]